MMIDGVWQGDVPDTPELVRRRLEGRRLFRGRVTADGSSGYPVPRPARTSAERHRRTSAVKARK